MEPTPLGTGVIDILLKDCNKPEEISPTIAFLPSIFTSDIPTSINMCPSLQFSTDIKPGTPTQLIIMSDILHLDFTSLDKL